MLDNHAILLVTQMKPSTFLPGLNIRSPPQVWDSNKQLPVVECPTGTVPILQNNKGENMSISSISHDGNGRAEVILLACPSILDTVYKVKTLTS